jgi:hypothetical protein
MLEAELQSVERQIERTEVRFRALIKVYGERSRVFNARIVAEGKRLAALLDQRKALRGTEEP